MPTYLYDQFRKVTVSPAIARARQLSSCDATLRESCTLPGRRGLCVATLVQGQQGDDGDAEKRVRYNVNGIELMRRRFRSSTSRYPCTSSRYGTNKVPPLLCCSPGHVPT